MWIVRLAVPTLHHETNARYGLLGACSDNANASSRSFEVDSSAVLLCFLASVRVVGENLWKISNTGLVCCFARVVPLIIEFAVAGIGPLDSRMGGVGD